jgi:hypothetical protein
MPDRTRIRLAFWLHHIWQQYSEGFDELEYEWSQLRRRWQRLQQAYRRCQLAQEYGWLLCLPGLQAELFAAIASLADVISALRTAYQPTAIPELTQRHWYHEVVQIFDEFPEVTFAKQDRQLRVETPAITLEGVELGAFAIDFKHEKRPSINNFTVTALDANPASNNEDIHHPHVKDGELCAGDAKAPLRAAIAHGRLCDAFLLIQSVLQNYNPNSAYVKLDQWHGTPCTDCSRPVDPEDSFTCNRCGNTLCDHCYSSCSSCSSTFCPGCIRGCAACHSDCCEACLDVSEGNGDHLCRQCRTSCDKCGKRVGKDELDDDLCQACVEQQEAEQTEEAEITQEVSHS